ncbi:class I SAM-dependent methyltransferase [Conexibacter sp. DBS9H8]|uniref:class I SAM-dependent methyltransferase n=1 Tax=Conexibacter sp. DBS9H8 TaxID=2937801 RepID=UPI00200ECA7C|nr:class I SAM-dependent methyltransferase [Conexibacter sp. DBS9H8]
MPETVTGERVVTSAGGFNPTYQRHVAAYRLAGALLGPGRVLDLGCGTGHSYRELAPRETVGTDIAAEVLAGQERDTVVADMRALPFPDGSFSSVFSVHSIEHVPDPERVIAEVRRVLVPGGRAIFVTPNRLTFGRPDEIIDPYHYIEFDAAALRALCAPFDRVSLSGLFGSQRYLCLVDTEHAELDRLLALDPLGLRRRIPRGLRQRLYDWRLSRSRALALPGAEAITPEDFTLRAGDDRTLASALDLVAVCDRSPEVL